MKKNYIFFCVMIFVSILYGQNPESGKVVDPGVINVQVHGIVNGGDESNRSSDNSGNSQNTFGNTDQRAPSETGINQSNNLNPEVINVPVYGLVNGDGKMETISPSPGSLERLAKAQSTFYPDQVTNNGMTGIVVNVEVMGLATRLDEATVISPR